MHTKQGIFLLIIVAIIAIATASAHLSCIYFGPQCYSAQMAPSAIVESAKSGTLLAPLGTIAVSILFVTLAAYALSAARLIRQLPLLNTGIYLIAALCIIRGILPLQLWLRHRSIVNEIELYVGFIWLAVGLFCFFGFRAMNKPSV
ncbi:hypothetical protein Q3O60_14575 [Alkalimonas collagenimarina]|uniref:DUF3995 domain-containing protein n=1 Tax=Alkalimonas collagenimarina TaxID=400390 RepID=A0ABT9H3D3_9GAMM|nr:hypothetical protein [Alkalimonas collagenimarina]MDP4537415.1 hypothetical protein [Alkalimonas collagenimarina]